MPAARRTADRTPPRVDRRRSAFTLLELLIVVTVIGILLSISVGATFAFLSTARESATKATLAKVDGKLQRRLSAFNIAGSVGGGSFGGGGPQSAMAIKNKQLGVMPQYMAVTAGPDGFLTDNLGTPQLETEDNAFALERDDVGARLLNANGDPAGPFAFDGPDPDNTPDLYTDSTASAEALYLFLERAETFGERDTDRSAFRQSELADSDGDGFLEIIDGFGNPLRFYRWPTRLIRPAPDVDGNGFITPAEAGDQGTGGKFGVVADRRQGGRSEADLEAVAALLLESSLPDPTVVADADGDPGTVDYALDFDPNDPFVPTTGSLLRTDGQDPFGLLPTILQEDARGIPFFQTAFVGGAIDQELLGLKFEQIFHTPATFYKAIVVSAGPDGELGLFEPQDRAAFGHLAQPGSRRNTDTARVVPLGAAFDNLTNLQRGFQ